MTDKFDSTEDYDKSAQGATEWMRATLGMMDRVLTSINSGEPKLAAFYILHAERCFGKLKDSISRLRGTDKEADFDMWGKVNK